MTLHKEGANTLISSLLTLFFINACLYYIVPSQLWIFWLVLAISIIIYGILLWFFRKPNRIAIIDSNSIYAPCDGKVVVIEDVVESEYYKEKCKQISIFMSPINVHINWYPVSGVVKYYKYHPGLKLVAWHPKSSELNERTTVVIETHQNKSILIRQIAGAMARRIVCYAKEDTAVEQGSEVGFIKFGSRMDIFVPVNTKIHVGLNQKVSGNKTVIASW